MTYPVQGPVDSTSSCPQTISSDPLAWSKLVLRCSYFKNHSQPCAPLDLHWFAIYSKGIYYEQKQALRYV